MSEYPRWLVHEDQPVHPNDVVDAYERTLWAIYEATGADTDGMHGPGALIAGMGREGFAGLVLKAVRRLAADYDEALDEIPPFPKES